jgi:nucleotidyltransferase substrate binding protein (TIGR01987 family)
VELELKSIRDATLSLERSINVALRKKNEGNAEIDEIETIRAGVIQNFEFTYEQCWKFMKRWLGENINSESVDGVSRRELFRMSAENKLIIDVDKWMEFHRARNITSHTYDEDTAQEVFDKTLEFLPFAKAFLERLEKS